MASQGETRIWYQSYTHPTEAADYLNALSAHINSVIDPGTTVDVIGLDPPANQVHAITEMRCGVQVVKNAIQAEKEGYDAFVIGHFQDAGLMEAKACVDIPVKGLGETTMLYACMLGKKFGLITIDPVFIRWHQEQVAAYGLNERMLGVHAMRTHPNLLVKAFAEEEAYQEVKKQFTEQSAGFVESGVDVLIPAGGLPMLLMAREKGLKIEGAPVLNGITITTKMAELAVKMHRLDGTGVSRRSNFVKPDALALSQFLGT